MYTDFKKPTMAEIEVNKLSKKFLSEIANTCIGKNIAEDTNIEIIDNSNNSSFVEDTEEEESNGEA